MNALKQQIQKLDARFCDLSPMQDIAYNLNNIGESLMDIKHAIEKGDREHGLVVQRTLVSDMNKLWKAYRQLENQLNKKIRS